MTETSFQKELISSFCHIFGERGYIKKIPDSYPAKGETRFTPPKPFDLFGYVNNKGFAIELKHSKSRSFSIDKIKDHQFENLIKVEETGAISLIILKISHKKSDTAFIMLPSVVYREKEKEKYSFDDLESKFHKLEKTIVKNIIVWDLRFLAKWN
jgi:penicillin-binding protein-related factor A (putative recombinase)